MSKAKIGDRFSYSIGGYRSVYEVAEILGGSGTPGPILVQLELVGRPRVGDAGFITVTEAQLNRKFTPIKTAITSPVVELPNAEEPTAEVE